MRYCFLISATVVGAIANSAQPLAAMTVDDLLYSCLSETDRQTATNEGLMRCVSYISGMLEMHAITVAMTGHKPMFCPPESGISSEDAISAFIIWTVRNPSERPKSARVGVVSALRSKYPCQAPAPSAPKR